MPEAAPPDATNHANKQLIDTVPRSASAAAGNAGGLLQSHAEIIRHTGTKPCTETCPFGLTETAVPVRLGEKTIGFLRIGQVLRRSAIQSDKRRAAAKLAECGVPFTGGIRKAWEATTIIPKEKYGAIVGLLTFFAEQLSTFINQIVLEKQNAEPLLVRKAREYIGQHKMEPLSLMAVARACFTSAKSSRERRV